MNIMNVDYSTRIPNNVGLTEDPRVLKALETWHPGYLDWWQDMTAVGQSRVRSPRMMSSVSRADETAFVMSARGVTLTR